MNAFMRRFRGVWDFLGVLILLVLGRLTISTALVLLTALAVLMSLWTERYLQNRDLPVQAEIFARSNLYFEYWKGKTHPNEWLYLKFAAGFMAAGLLLGRRWWPLAGGGLATMAVLPYISGYFPFNLQLISGALRRLLLVAGARAGAAGAGQIRKF